MKAQFQWTIMLYLSGDNNLSEEMIRTLEDIRAEQMPRNVAFTIQFDPRAPNTGTLRYAIANPPLSRNSGKPTRAERTMGPLPIPEYLRESIPSEDSADPAVLADFIKWSAKTCPSTHRMLILSGHGGGAVGDFLTDDNGSPGALTIPLLARALQSAKKSLAKARRIKANQSLLDILGMDSCLMGMAEVSYQVRAHVDYLVGSEGFVPNAGWPYGHLLRRLKTRDPADRTPTNMSAWIVKDVVSHYERFLSAGVSFDMAAVDLAALEDVAEAMRRLKDSLQPGLRQRLIQDLVVAAHWRAQSYKFELHTDLRDFCELLGRAAKQARRKGIAKSCQGVLDAVEAAVVQQANSGTEFQHSHGLSVYFPWANSKAERAALKDYGKLRFPMESGWSDFLKVYLESTQRERRKQRGQFVPLERFARPFAQTFGPGKASENTNKASENTNKASENTNKVAEGTNRLFTMLYSGLGVTLPGSMKNPPDGVNAPRVG